MSLRFQQEEPEGKVLGLIVLQADETIEGDFRRLIPARERLHVSRVPSAEAVSPESLQEMENHIAASAGLFPRGLAFDAVGYGCTSGAAQIGPERVAALIREGVSASGVSEPVSALVAACQALSVGRLALLSPYVEPVSARLRDALAARGVATPVFGSFDVAEERRVVRIDGRSVIDAAVALAERGGVEAVFLSCTNLRTLDVIAEIEARTGLPVMSSNSVLAWHMCGLAGIMPEPFGRLAGR